MITRGELREKAELFDLNEADIQRDYVFGWLISGLYRKSALAQSLVLKGGNALRKGYFIGARFSDDLDFSTSQSFDKDALLNELNQVCESLQSEAAIPFDIARNRVVDEHQVDRGKKVLKLKLYFDDFLTGSDNITISVRMDVTEYDRLYLPVQDRILIHPYSDADACSTTIRCVKLEEALADKMKCLLQRRYCNDLFDLAYGAFISTDIAVDRSEMMTVFLKKTIFERNPGFAKGLLLDLPVDLFRGYWHTVLCPAVSRMSIDDAVSTIKLGLEELFAPYGQGLGSAYAFYPSNLRNIILQAGSEKKLMRLTYDGMTRTVEPYSLVFKRRKDGAAFEYFYVWNRTGGRSGTPGIRALFHHRIQSLEILDETFEPRFPIELSKAGDSTQSGYFSRPNRPSTPRGTRLTSTPRRRTSFGPTYVIRCSYCGKEFRRKKQGFRLNDHKDRFGNKCYGRAGHLLRVEY